MIKDQYESFKRQIQSDEIIYQATKNLVGLLITLACAIVVVVIFL